MPFFYKKTKRKKFCLILLFFPLSDLFLHQFLDKILYFSSSQAAYYMLQNTSSNCFSWYNDIKKPHFSFLRYAVMFFYPYAGFHSLYSLILYIYKRSVSLITREHQAILHRCHAYGILYASLQRAHIGEACLLCHHCYGVVGVFTQELECIECA